MLFLILLITFSAFSQKNLVKNGDFETGLEFWRGDAATISSFEKKSGKNSAVINQYVGAEWKGIDQLVSIPKNTYAIEFSLWIKTDAIEKGEETYNAGIVTLDFMNVSETNISYENIVQLTGNSPWTFYKKQIVLPENVKKMRVMLALAQTNGSIFFDSVKVVTLTEDAYLKQTETLGQL